MEKLTEEQIEKAVNWWADRVVAPIFDGLSKEERKDPVNEALVDTGVGGCEGWD